eukprot:COSAG01_NODE_2565_length_7448_cov_405.607566_6_plen_104_part_00
MHDPGARWPQSGWGIWVMHGKETVLNLPQRSEDWKSCEQRQEQAMVVSPHTVVHHLWEKHATHISNRDRGTRPPMVCDPLRLLSLPPREAVAIHIYIMIYGCG